MTDHYNTVIVGAGPAGSMTALSILQNDPGTSVLLVDRRKEIGRPVQCAGGIVKHWLDQLGLEIPDEVIATPLRGACLHGPSGGVAEWDAKPLTGDQPLGYVMYRDRFDQWLAAMACEAGADLRLEDDPSKGDQPYDYDSRYLIGADGWRSQVGQRFLSPHACDLDLGKDYHNGVEVRVALSEPCDPGLIHLYFGNELAPGGYVWVFPESKHIVRVGCGVQPPHKARPYLERFLHYDPPDEWMGEVLGISAGGIIPTSRPAYRLFQEVMRPSIRIPSGSPQIVALVGDAARMTDPVHGGGIANGMVAAKKLGEVIASGAPIREYGHWFRKNLGKELERRYLLKKVLTSWNDKELDGMVEVMADYQVTAEPINTQVRNLVVKLLLKKPLMFPMALGTALKAKFMG